MKKILIALALVSVSFASNAQVKKPADAKKAVESAEAVAANPKKQAKADTWIKLAKAYNGAYESAKGQVLLGSDIQQIHLLQNGQKPKSTETVELSDGVYTKETYRYHNYYYDQANCLALVEVTEEVVPDALAKCLEAYGKAHEVDAKGAKTKDIQAGIRSISQNYQTDAIVAYRLGNVALSCDLFLAAANALAKAPCSEVDSLSLYNAGFTALSIDRFDVAIDCFVKCIEVGHFEDGDAYAKLAQAYGAKADTLAMVSTYEKGFTAFPQNQAILIGLINHYLASKTNTDRLFELLGEAKKNEPNNASLYYVEGNIKKELGRIEEAEAAYLQASEVNKDYEYGFIGAGQMYYDLAVQASEEASQEMDDSKYTALMEKANGYLKSALPSFESAFKVSKDNSVRVVIAEYLKNIYFRFRTESQEYSDAYNKYDEIVKTKVIPE